MTLDLEDALAEQSVLCTHHNCTGYRDVDFADMITNYPKGTIFSFKCRCNCHVRITPQQNQQAILYCESLNHDCCGQLRITSVANNVRDIFSIICPCKCHKLPIN